jgi:RimJ/RimL family protein N-acetyltransferase
MDIPTLTTDRLVLRPFTDDDLTELVAVHAEESFWWYPLRRAMSGVLPT